MKVLSLNDLTSVAGGAENLYDYNTIVDYTCTGGILGMFPGMLMFLSGGGNYLKPVFEGAGLGFLAGCARLVAQKLNKHDYPNNASIQDSDLTFTVTS